MLKPLITTELIENIVSLIPDNWLISEDGSETPGSMRKIYVAFLESRINHADVFLKEALNARSTII
ncbi:MAG: hypothetical protein EOO02_21490 [Chitinophagaceae bacterium]|nr:MAG: hypothetical protein EOO02_21490 [Chitinophagaceae bacterium]